MVEPVVYNNPMNISDLEIVIENLSGSYKKFADSLEDYPILGVTYPTHYGYIKGYKSEDGHDLDVFIGNGDIFGWMKVKRDEIPDGIETKFIIGVNKKEFDEIKQQFGPVIAELKSFDQNEFLERIQLFKVEIKGAVV